MESRPLKFTVIPVTPFLQNCTLLWCTASMRGAVVDPGGDLERILGAVEEHGVTLEKILLTHAHIDHAGGTAELAECLGLPIEGPHREDQFWIDALPQQSRMFGFPEVARFAPDRWLQGGDLVQLGAATLEVRHCPGHTPGHGPLSTFGEERRSNPFVAD